MFLQIAIGAIGIGIVLMVGYLIIAQIGVALPTTDVYAQVANPCYGKLLNDTTYCNVSSYDSPTYGTIPGPFTDASSPVISVQNTQLTAGVSAVKLTVFAGFSLIAVGIIVLAAFGLISVFK